MSVRDYSRWIARASEAGLSREQITTSLEAWMAEDLALLKGLCPTCGAPIRAIADSSNRGAPDEGPGVFVMYRCSRDAPPGEHGERPCGYAMDRWEQIQ